MWSEDEPESDGVPGREGPVRALKTGKVVVNSRKLQQHLQCNICLDLCRSTHAMQVCLHRFCKECIETALRLAKNECPSCRNKCPSRRSLRPDGNFDHLVDACFPKRHDLEEQEDHFMELLLSNQQNMSKAIERSRALQMERGKRAGGRHAVSPWRKKLRTSETQYARNWVSGGDEDDDGDGDNDDDGEDESGGEDEDEDEDEDDQESQATPEASAVLSASSSSSSTLRQVFEDPELSYSSEEEVNLFIQRTDGGSELERPHVRTSRMVTLQQLRHFIAREKHIAIAHILLLIPDPPRGGKEHGLGSSFSPVTVDLMSLTLGQIALMARYRDPWTAIPIKWKQV